MRKLMNAYRSARQKQMDKVIAAVAEYNEQRKPCKGHNANVCIAEGCHGESCLTLSDN